MDFYFGTNSILATMENVATLVYGALQKRPRMGKREIKIKKECWMSW